MRTKFKDAKDLLDYAEAAQKAKDAALFDFTEADKNLRSKQAIYHDHLAAFRTVGNLVARLTLPDDMRETPEAKGEWIIIVHFGSKSAYATNCEGDTTHYRSEALRFTSEEAANDFAADHWRGWQPKVAPYEAPAEPEIKVGGRALYDFHLTLLSEEPCTVVRLEPPYAYVDFDNKDLNDGSQPACVALCNLKPITA